MAGFDSFALCGNFDSHTEPVYPGDICYYYITNLILVNCLITNLFKNML